MVQRSEITITGAREHNLANIDVTLPRDKLVVLTGVSGSGKSSLAFDTIYAEGQRRYVESLSAYARQFLELMDKPDVDSIEGLSPAIAIEQKTTSRNPRSTVGTVTEIYDYLRLLYARVGVPYSPATGQPITAQSVSQMVDRMMAQPQGKRLYILAPVVRGRKGEYRKQLQDFARKGYQRAQIDGTIYRILEAPPLERHSKHDIEIVVDRIQVSPDIKSRLADSVETTLELADGIMYVDGADDGERTIFSSRFACPISGFTIDEIEPRLFSFNNPHGACPRCDGLGCEESFDPRRVIPNETLSIKGGAIAPWAKSRRRIFYHGNRLISRAADSRSISTTIPWGALPPAARTWLLDGDQEPNKSFVGIMALLERQYRKSDGWLREDLARYTHQRSCSLCEGTRLKAEALAVNIDGKNIAQITAKTVDQCRAWFEDLPAKMVRRERDISDRILREITQRLTFLGDVGLGYLTLDRASATLSGGEGQRIRLASQIGSGLTGVLYVLDEPSIGLHQRDNRRLLDTLERLRDLGNTVIVVEHDEETIRHADYIVDMGPAAGEHGGTVVAKGTPRQIMRRGKGLTAQYLTGQRQIDIPKRRLVVTKNHPYIEVVGATANNLDNIDARFPLAALSCVTGVSGSGKSSLVIETLYKGLTRILTNAGYQDQPIQGQEPSVDTYKELRGVGNIDKVIDIDQSPIGRTPRSNPATYTGMFTPIRDWFTGLPEARIRGYQPGRFSFNVRGGRCEACQGDGLIKIEMHFLPDVYVLCDECRGKRYNRETLEITFKDQSIADVLEMTVDQAVDFFRAMPSIRSKLEVLSSVGLGYIRLGQQATTLSGGEAQRVRLARELSRRSHGRTLYILDEPTTGLHHEDVRKLLGVLNRLIDQGNTVIVIEHHLDVIKTADWIIDIGPEGGSGGGTIVASGPPEEVVKVKASHTGRYLKPILAKG